MKVTRYRRQAQGLTLVEVVVVVVVLCVMVTLLLPMLARSKHGVPGSQCVGNLKQIGLAFRLWVSDHNDKFPMQIPVADGGTMELGEGGDVYPHFLVLSNELNTPKVLYCAMESDTNRIVASTFAREQVPDGAVPFTNSSNVTYFVGINADQTRPRLLLSGDNSFTVAGMKPAKGLLHLWNSSQVGWDANRHSYGGNVSLADGSVQKLDSQNLKRALLVSGVSTNRLAMP